MLSKEMNEPSTLHHGELDGSDPSIDEPYITIGLNLA